MHFSILCQLALAALAIATPYPSNHPHVSRAPQPATPPAPPPPKQSPARAQNAALAPAFIMAGDSTVGKSKGCGDGFLKTLINGATGVNLGRNGATTDSFMSGGDWTKVIDEVKKKKGSYIPYVTFQFGHNDQKKVPIEKFMANLKTMAQEIIAAGGIPVAVTSIARRKYASGTIKPDLAPQVAAALQVAQELGIAFIDLNAESTKYLNSITEAEARTYDYAEGDSTHLNPQAALLFGTMTSQLILKSQVGDAVKAFLSPDPAIAAAIDSGTYMLPPA
ncbi:putative gdsl-like lipase acylhydrolase protein [Diplocarpon rosae]|nr:putative gdsl-like lipase acylhydrolase protein [Diplocarpon rosae]